MKKHRTLYALLALCLIVGILWYSCIALLQKGTAPVLVDVEGDPSALQGFTLDGMVTDSAFAQHFTLENGKLDSKFLALSQRNQPTASGAWCYANAMPVPAPSAQLTAPQRDSSENAGVHLWTMQGDRLRILLRCNLSSNSPDEYAIIDTGLEVQGKPEEFTFSAYGDDNWGFTNSWQCFSNLDIFSLLPSRNTPTVECMADDTLYVAYNLPWGGAKLYEVTSFQNRGSDFSAENELMGSLEEPNAKTDLPTAGESKELLTFSPSEVSQVVGIHQIGDFFVVLTQSNASDPCFVLNSDGHLENVPGPEKDCMEARIYDSNWNCTETAFLTDLPQNDTQMWGFTSTQFTQPSNGFDDLYLTLHAYAHTSTSMVNAIDFSVLLRLENGRITVKDVRRFDAPLPQQTENFTFTGHYPTLLTARLDETGTKALIMWFAGTLERGDWSMQPIGGQIYLDVLEKDQLLYRGELKADLLDDVLNGLPHGLRQNGKPRVLAMPIVRPSVLNSYYAPFDFSEPSYLVPFAG